MLLSFILSPTIFLQQNFASYEVNSCRNEILSTSYNVWTANTNHIIKERLVDVGVNFAQRWNDSAISEYRTFLSRWVEALSQLQREVDFNQTQNNMIDVVKDFLSCQRDWAAADAGILIWTTLGSINPDGTTTSIPSVGNNSNANSSNDSNESTTNNTSESTSEEENLNDDRLHPYYQYLWLHPRATDDNGTSWDQNCVILHWTWSRSTNGWYTSPNSCQQLCDNFDGDTRMCFYEWDLLKTYWSVNNEVATPSNEVSCLYNDTNWSRSLWSQTPANCVSLCDYHSQQWESVLSCEMNWDIIKTYELESDTEDSNTTENNSNSSWENISNEDFESTLTSREEDSVHPYYEYLSLHPRATANNGEEGDQNCVILHGNASRSTNGWYSSTNACTQLCNNFEWDVKMCFYEGELIKTYWSEDSNVDQNTWNEQNDNNTDSSDERDHPYYEYLSLHPRATYNNGAEGDQTCVILHGNASRSTNGWYSSANACIQRCGNFEWDVKMCFYEGELIETFNGDTSSNSTTETENTSNSQRCLVIASPNDNGFSFSSSLESENACLEACDETSGSKYQCKYGDEVIATYGSTTNAVVNDMTLNCNYDRNDFIANLYYNVGRCPDVAWYNFWKDEILPWNGQAQTTSYFYVWLNRSCGVSSNIDDYSECFSDVLCPAGHTYVTNTRTCWKLNNSIRVSPLGEDYFSNDTENNNFNTSSSSSSSSSSGGNSVAPTPATSSAIPTSTSVTPPVINTNSSQDFDCELYFSTSSKSTTWWITNASQCRQSCDNKNVSNKRYCQYGDEVIYEYPSLPRIVPTLITLNCNYSSNDVIAGLYYNAGRCPDTDWYNFWKNDVYWKLLNEGKNTNEAIGLTSWWFTEWLDNYCGDYDYQTCFDRNFCPSWYEYEREDYCRLK